MRLSLLFGGFGPIADTWPLVRAAEDAGLHGVWYAEHLGFHDAVVPAAAALATTRRLEVGCVGPALVSRHPGLLAMELASLWELGPGRVRVQVGLGDAGLIARLGGGVKAAAPRVEAYVRGLRTLLAGEPLTGDVAGYPFSDYRVSRFAPDAPCIDVMAMRPRMIEAAARVGDGIGISAGASRDYIRDCVRSVAAHLARLDRPRRDYRITGFVLTAIRASADEAHAELARQLRGFPAEGLGLLAPGLVDAVALQRARESGDREEVADILAPDVVRQVALATTPAGLEGALEALEATGIDELCLSLVGPAEHNVAAVAELARFAARRSAHA